MKRTPKPAGLAPGDPRHGSTAGYLQGCKCPECKAAIATYQRRRRKRAQLYGVGYSVDATGSKRRIEALYALGWLSTDLIEAMGYRHRNRLHQVRNVKWVERSTAARIAKAYEQMSMMIPPDTPLAKRQRTIARKKGWAPPLAWDNIDDPNERPKGTIGIVPQRPRCGSDTAYRSHLRNNEQPCDPCKAAHTQTRRGERKAA